jgi:hypothetical protein
MILYFIARDALLPICRIKRLKTCVVISGFSLLADALLRGSSVHTDGCTDGCTVRFTNQKKPRRIGMRRRTISINCDGSMTSETKQISFPVFMD